MADVINNLDHITLNTNTPTRVPNTTLQQTPSPDITTVYNTLYNRTSWTTQHALSSDHLPTVITINIRHDYRLQQNLQTFTNYKKADWTQFTEDTEPAFAQTTIPTKHHTDNRIFTNIILMAEKGNMHRNCNPDSKPLAVHRWQPPVGHWRFVCCFSGGPLVATAQGFFNFMIL